MADLQPVTGGCQCGRVRYAMHVDRVEKPHVCQCRMCQKATGGLFAALAGCAKDRLDWTRGEPAMFASSSLATRGFCRDCGTPLTFESEKNFDLAIFAFDRAHDITPVIQLEPQRGAAWLAHVAEMEVLEPPPGYLEGIVSRQHPDHDTDAWPPAA
jgi:hypothetical protein